MTAVPVLTQELIEQQAITGTQNMNNGPTWEKILAAAVVGALISVAALYINEYVPKLMGKR